MATQTVAAGSQVVKSVLANTAHRDLFGKVDVDFQQSPIPGAALGFADDIYLDNFRKWIDAI